VDQREGDDHGERPPWAGAPGYLPPAELPPHAPLPGAPPYPAREEPPPAEVGEQAPPRTGLLPVLAAAAVWALVDVALVLIVGAPPFGARFLAGVAVTLAVTAAGVWLLARRSAWPWLVLVLVSAPVFWVLRALAGAVLG
jgi:hypothetical protein